MRIVIAGVSGSGKSTIGALLAERLSCEFLDADDFHPPENIARMRAGISLDDESRAGWLEILGRELAMRSDVVLACSALKLAYRERLRQAAAPLAFFLMDPPLDLLRQRISQRQGHFMPVSLLDSQFAALERGSDLLEIHGAESPEVIIDQIQSEIQARIVA